MALQGELYGLPLATLQALQTTYATALTQIVTGGQSYSISGRTFTRASLPEIRRTLLEITQAIGYTQGTRNTVLYPNFSNCSPAGGNGQPVLPC